MVWSIIDETHRQIIEELESQTDRGAAIIGASLLDRRLEEAIRVHLLDNKVTEKLFDASQALGSFSAKIDLAYSLGLYGEKSYHDLNLIRKIRNEFAHFDTPLNFDSQSVASRCAELWFPKNVEINNQPIAPKEARAQYLRANYLF
ncbi:MAG: hypothetical protein HS126_37015 [Anaerolineales bacterium]|nr:hypothetical protein [Anaerolineales bacterium]